MVTCEGLKNELERRNMSVRKLALTAGIIPQAVYACMKGRAYWWPGYRNKIAEALQMSESDLFEGYDD